jgi:hypothetical protein
MRSRFGEGRKRAPKLTAREAQRNYRWRCTAGLAGTPSFGGSAPSAVIALGENGHSLCAPSGHMNCSEAGARRRVPL